MSRTVKYCSFLGASGPEPLIRRPFCSDNMILADLSGSFARPRSWRRPPHPPLARDKHRSTGGQGRWRTPPSCGVAAAVIAAAMFSSLPLSAPDDYECTQTNSTSCIPSSSVTNVRNMLESCDNYAGREKKKWEYVPPPCGVAKSGRRGDRSLLPDAYYQATGTLHPARYHSIVMPDRGRWLF
jgi:hypothetical protein